MNVDRFGRSDPFVVCHLGDEKRKTSVINNDLSPRWKDEKVAYMEWFVYDKGQVLDIKVKDHDVTRSQLLGYTDVVLNTLEDNTKHSLELPLSGGKGTVTLAAEYLPFLPNEKQGASAWENSAENNHPVYSNGGLFVHIENVTELASNDPTFISVT